MKSDDLHLLLDLSSAISAVRYKEDLFRVIVEKIKPVFEPSGHAAIITFDNSNEYFQIFLSEMPLLNIQEKKELMAEKFPIDPIIKKIRDADDPVVISLEPLWEKYPDLMVTRITKKLGIKEIMGCALIVSGKRIGSIHLHSLTSHYFHSSQFPLFKATADMIAVAVSNILANEEIKKRENEKSQLLAISSHIASVRDKNDLFHLIAEKVRSFIPFDDAVVTLVNEEQTYFQIFLSDEAVTTSLHKDYREAVTRKYPIQKGSIPDRVIQSERPIIFDLKMELFKNPATDYLKFAYDFGMRQEMVTKLVYSGKLIGHFALLSKTPDIYTEEHSNTLTSLSSLIAIAVQNVIANEAIEYLARQLKQDNQYLNEELKSNYNFEEMIGVSAPLQDVLKKIIQVAPVDITVLLLGETGTGKELVARAIHNLSGRKNRPMIKINCAALPAQLIESELFGHEKGSFTGATEKRLGKIELANGSTIFLDEIGELPLELQAKLLRALQEKEIERIGSDKTIKVDVRIIAATNRNLQKEVANGRFRSDLYYRLNIYPIELPALRERREDIPLLASHFIQKHSKKLGKKITGLSTEVLDELVSADWPGNIRELEHTIERSMLLTNGTVITSLNLPNSIIASVNEAGLLEAFHPVSLADHERELILKTLKYTKGKIRGKLCAAELLDIQPTTLEARMKKLGIKKEFT